MEEFYVITWTAKKEQIFEMPTGGAAIMRQGPNLLKLARKASAGAPGRGRAARGTGAHAMFYPSPWGQPELPDRRGRRAGGRSWL